MKGYWVLAIVLAFVAGSIVTGGLAYASPGNGQPFQVILDAIDDLQIMLGMVKEDVAQLQEDVEELQSSGGSVIPISIGHSSVIRDVIFCVHIDDYRTNAVGAIVLLSDGTVMVPSLAGGFKNPNSEFGSLPDGVWVDVEGVYGHSILPEDCNLGNPAEEDEFLDGCAVNEEGEVWCINGKLRNGVFQNNEPRVWTFQGDAIP